MLPSRTGSALSRTMSSGKGLTVDFETLSLFVLTEALLSLTPGPAVLLVLGLSVRHGSRMGFAATAGIITTNAVYFTLSAVGVGAMILASATLFTIIKWIGAGYLAYLGIQMIVPLVRRLICPAAENAGAVDVQGASRAVGDRAGDLYRSFRRGFVLQASNPKNIAFFVAILPQFVVPDENLAGQLIILGVASVLIELPILVLYAIASSRSAALMKERLVEWIEGIAGGILIGMGSALALTRQ